ncbi:MAG: hypothetical protein SFZ02_16275 [bacterium]|nr:hypothetical protein [bacterium]
MRLFAKFILILALFCASLPIFAQEETPAPPIDPEGEFTEVYTLENITINYPTGLFVSDSQSQITIDFDGTSTDYITIAPPAAFDLFEIPNDTLQVASQNIFNTFSGGLGADVTYDDIVTETTLAGLDATYFMLEANGAKIYVYIFAVGEEIFAATLITQEVAISADAIGDYETVADFEVALMVKIIETMTVDGEPIAQEVSAEATDIAPVTEFETRLVPADVVELGQEVAFVDAGLTFSIPAEWVVDDVQMIVATSDVALASMSSGETPTTQDEIVIQIISPNRMPELPLDKITAENVLQVLLESYPDATKYQYQDTTFPTYYVPLVGDNVPLGAFLIVTQLSENPADVLVVIGLTLDYDTAEPTLFSILNTVVYTPPVGE